MTKIIDSILHDNEGNIIHPETNISQIRGSNDTDKTLEEELTELKQQKSDLDAKIKDLESKLNAEITRSTDKDTSHDTDINDLKNKKQGILDAGSGAALFLGNIIDASYVSALPPDASSSENATRLYLIPVS